MNTPVGGENTEDDVASNLVGKDVKGSPTLAKSMLGASSMTMGSLATVKMRLAPTRKDENDPFKACIAMDRGTLHNLIEEKFEKSDYRSEKSDNILFTEKDDDNGWTVLMHMCWKGEEIIISRMLSDRRNIDKLNIVDNYGRTALCIAVQFGMAKAVDVLVAFGADPLYGANDGNQNIVKQAFKKVKMLSPSGASLNADDRTVKPFGFSKSHSFYGESSIMNSLNKDPVEFKRDSSMLAKLKTEISVHGFLKTPNLYSTWYKFTRMLNFHQTVQADIGVCAYNISLLRLYAQHRTLKLATAKKDFSKRNDETKRLKIDQDIIRILNHHPQVQQQRLLQAFIRTIMASWQVVAVAVILTCLGIVYSNQSLIANFGLVQQDIASVTNPFDFRVSNFQKNFMGIQNSQDFFNFLSTSFAENILIQSPPNSEYWNIDISNIGLQSIVMRQIQVNPSPCYADTATEHDNMLFPFSKNYTNQCYPIYSTDVVNKDPMQYQTNYGNQTIKYSPRSDYTFPIYGLNRVTYQPEGHFLALSSNLVETNATFQLLLAQSYINTGTRLVTVTYNVWNTVLRRVSIVTLVLEIDAAAFFQPWIKIYTVNWMPYYEFVLTEISEWIVSIYLQGYLLYEVFFSLKNFYNKKATLSAWIAIDLALMFCMSFYIASFYLFNYYRKNDSFLSNYVNSATFNPNNLDISTSKFGILGFYNDQRTKYIALCTTLTWFKLLHHVRLTPKLGPVVDGVIGTLSDSRVVSFFFFFVYYLIVVAISCYIMFSMYLQEFSDFGSSILTALIGALGNYPTSDMFSVNRDMAIFTVLMMAVLGQIIFSNLLIAVLSNVYTDVSETAEEAYENHLDLDIATKLYRSIAENSKTQSENMIGLIDTDDMPNKKSSFNWNIPNRLPRWALEETDETKETQQVIIQQLKEMQLKISDVDKHHENLLESMHAGFKKIEEHMRDGDKTKNVLKRTTLIS